VLSAVQFFKMAHVPAALQPKEEDIKKLLAVGAHIGTQNIDSQMNRYVWRRRPDGIHVINIAKTWEKLVFAARIIAGIENPAEICVISGPIIGQRAALKFANFTGAQAIAGRYTPGTFTNQIQEKFIEPRLLIITDPRADHQALKEASYVNLPTIALCNSDSSACNVDIVIPCNNRSTESVGLIYWLLAREILFLRGTIPRTQPWDVMVDMFFYRPPEEIIAEKKAQEEAQAQAQAQNQNQNQNQNQAHVQFSHQVPFEAPQAAFRQEGGGQNWAPIQTSNVVREGPWDSAQGESWAGGNRGAFTNNNTTSIIRT
jgi:small subunit ribosomal protein SAe